MMKGILLVLLLGATGALSACRRSAPPPEQGDRRTPDDRAHAEKDSPAKEHDKAEAHQDEPQRHEELPSRVKLTPQVQRDAHLRTAPAVLKALPATVELTGEVSADPDRSARITARVAGRVVEVRVKEGARVKAGQVLAVLESSEAARARAAFVAAQARAGAAHKNAERLASLLADGLAAGQEVQGAQAEARSLQAEAAAHERALLTLGVPTDQLGQGGARVELRAPLAGVVVARSAVVGQTVSAEHALCEIVDLSRAYFLGRLFEKNLSRVHSGAVAEVRLNAYPGEVFLGAVEAIGTQLDPAARTVIARVLIADREERLKVGLFGTARVVSTEPAEQAPRLVVPLSALTRIAERDVVFVRQPDDDFEVHPVVVGRTAAGQAEILSGLRADEQVVVEGLFTLKSAVLKSTFGEED